MSSWSLSVVLAGGALAAFVLAGISAIREQRRLRACDDDSADWYPMIPHPPALWIYQHVSDDVAVRSPPGVSAGEHVRDDVDAIAEAGPVDAFDRVDVDEIIRDANQALR